MPQVLVTGASGFIGRNVITYLESVNIDSIACVRSQKGSDYYQNMKKRVVQGDLFDVAEFIECNDIDAVIHLAADVAPYARSTAFQTNVEGTRALVEACRKKQTPPVMLYISSLSAAGPAINDVPRKETDPAKPRSIYGESKRAAEIALESYANEVPITVLRPPAVIGPWDRNLLPMYSMVRNRVHLVGISRKYRYSFLHVEDLARGMLLAIQNGKRMKFDDEGCSDHQLGKVGIYHLADPQPYGFEHLAEMVASSIGCRKPFHLTIPKIFCWSVAMAADLRGRLFGIPTYLNIDKMKEAVCGSWIADVSLAQADLPFSIAKPLSVRVAETTDWYRSKRWI